MSIALAFPSKRRSRLVLPAATLALLALLVTLGPVAIGPAGDLVDLYHRLAQPSLAHLLGTDELGRDLLLRLCEGGRVSLLVGLVASLAAAGLGTAIGLVAGYRGGRLDALLMRLTDGVIALPLLPLLIVLAALDLDKIGLGWVARSDAASLYRIIVLVALVGWTTVARLVRGATLSLKSREFVRAAVAMGVRPTRIMLVHILPNVAPIIIVATTLSVGDIILLESVLSFLGLGVAPPLASWGNMLTGAEETIALAPRLALFPGILILVTVVACNFLGDGLQQALDPRARRE